MNKKWIKRIVLALVLTPIILILLTVFLFYTPFVQNYFRKEAIAYLSRQTGMDVYVDHVDLRFPLRLMVRDVRIVQTPDTIFTLQSLGTNVRLFPLFRGRIEPEDMMIKGGVVNTANLIAGMRIQAVLSEFNINTNGIDLRRQTAEFKSFDIKDSQILLLLNDTTTSPKDTTQTVNNWKVTLDKFNLDNVTFNLQMPRDTMQLDTYFPKAEITDIDVDLFKKAYALESFNINNATVNYNKGTAKPIAGFDPSHIALRDIQIELEDVAYGPGMNTTADIKALSMNERSGLSIASTSGSLRIDSTQVRIPELNIKTNHSELHVEANVYWDIKTLENDRIVAKLNARLDKQDIFLFTGGLSESFKRQFPSFPMVVQIAANGNASKVDITSLNMNLPGAFNMTGDGVIEHITDSVNRAGQVELQIRTQNLNFLKPLIGLPRDSSFLIPRNMSMALKADMRGSQYHANLRARESNGIVNLNATYNTRTEAYTANLKIDSLQLNHFLPKDSIYRVDAVATAKGRGLNFASTRSVATVDATISRLQYRRFRVGNIHLNGELKNAIASATFSSDNQLLVMKGVGDYALNTRYTKANAIVDIDNIDLLALGLITDTIKKPIALHLEAKFDLDTTSVNLNSGDLTFRLRSRSTLQRLISESTTFTQVLTKQIHERKLNHAELRRALPSAVILLNAGTDNPLYYYLALQDIKYKELKAGFVATPDIGINGNAFVYQLKVDTLQLDTVYFSIRQDTALMAFRGGVINGPHNPQYVFNASLTGEVRSEDAEFTLKFIDAQGRTGVLLGVNGRPQPDGMLFTLIPEHPTVAYRTFSYNGHNTVFVRNNYRVIADVEMLDSIGTGLRVRSLEEADSTYLQNLDIELRAIELAELSQVLPYLPHISGLLFLEANYKKSAHEMQVSAEANIGQFYYEDNRVGNIGLGATWLPDNQGTHYLNAYMTNEEVQILTADGTYQTHGDALSVGATLEHFPLYITNAFIPDQIAELSGDVDGGLAITGTPSHPVIDGELILDSVTVSSWKYGLNFRMDNRPLHIQNSRMTFDGFAIYTTSDNPFTIDGFVDMRQLSNPTADLLLRAQNYQLLNAPRTRDAMLYGTVFINFNATARGPLNNLVVRGDVTLLNNTDVTYVMIDSPLSVQDRLGDLVIFTSFADTAIVKVEEPPTSTITGIQVNMSIHIDPTVKINVDLSPDRSSHIELQGGGNLAFQHSRQGNMSLSGRYTLSGGTVKYALPVVPLKEFTINEGSYVEWSGEVTDPLLNFSATERMRVSVPNPEGGSRMVNFDVSIVVRNRLNDLNLVFNLVAPDDADVQRQLAAMDEAERSKQAITLMATGMFLAGGGAGGDFNMGNTLNSLLQSQIASIMGDALQHVNIAFGVDNYNDVDGSRRTNYNFSYSQRFFNDRVQVVIGGSISSGNQGRDTDAFIDNVSLEYRLDETGTRYVRLFHNREYENLLESDITETGGGLLLRRRVNRLGELFIFRRNRK